MTMTTHPVLYELPDKHCELIGKFITRWAHLEWRLREAMYAALDVSPKIGRVAIQEPRIGDYVTMIEDVTKLLDIQTSIDWQKFKEGLRPIESWRNKFAHGIWIDHPNETEPVLQDTKGTTVDPQDGSRTKAKINPKGVTVRTSELENAIAGVDKAVEIARDLKREIEAQRAS